MGGDDAFDQRVGGPIELPRRASWPSGRNSSSIETPKPARQFVQRAGVRMVAPRTTPRIVRSSSPVASTTSSNVRPSRAIKPAEIGGDDGRVAVTRRGEEMEIMRSASPSLVGIEQLWNGLYRRNMYKRILSGEIGCQERRNGGSEPRANGAGRIARAARTIFHRTRCIDALISQERADARRARIHELLAVARARSGVCVCRRRVGIVGQPLAWEPAKGPLDDAVDQGRFAGAGVARISAAADGAREVGESQRPVELRDSAGGRRAAGDVGRRDPGAVRGRIGTERREEAGAAGGAAVVSAEFRCADAERRRTALLLHFGAVDWKCTVWVNGKEVGEHTGGYDPFTFDITDALQDGRERSWSSRCRIRPTRAISRAASRCSSRRASCTRR